MNRPAFACLLAFGIVSPTMAQNITVQQPVVQQFGVGTTVSVPDRGSILLGGVSTGRTGTRRGGFSPFGTNTGREFTNGSMSASVYIHDLAGMDAALLNSGGGSGPLAVPQTDSELWHLRHGRRAPLPSALSIRQTTGPLTARTAVRRPSPLPSDPAGKAAKFWKLGQSAEAAGKLGTARIHYRMAARHGSEAANVRLAELDSEATPVATR